MRTPEPALELEGVWAGYGDAPALRDVTLRVGPGEVVGLVGPNGSGKTTLVRVASRALRPRSGRVRVLGRDPYAMGAREAARLVAVVPQEVAPAFSFTALEIVLMGRTPYGSIWGGGSPQDWARTRAAMTAASVQHLADRPVEELSGGERQRVILAQAMAQDAPVLLLDEPTSHLDVRHLVDVLAIVRGLAEGEGVAVLAILHDLNVASIACDRLVVLDRGRVVAEGEPASVLTRRLLRDVYGLDADVRADEATGRPAIRLGLPAATTARHGRRAHVVGGAGRGAPVLRRLTRAGYEVSVGVLHAGDTDDEVAERLALLRVSVPPFSAIDPESAGACLELMRRAELLVVCDAPFGPGNLENLRLALAAASSGVRTVLVEATPIEERDFTRGEATRLWRELRGLAEVVRDYGAVPVEAG